MSAAATATLAPPTRVSVQLARNVKTQTATGSGRRYSYGWPVKPFDRQHPVRGNFGDPRTTFYGDPTPSGIRTSRCDCSHHPGIDISAPDGTEVYPVESGTVSIVTAQWVEVSSGAGHAFQYWHIAARVRPGDHVDVGRSVLGRILRGSQHVHLTELVDRRPVNPLARGHIGPYEDPTAPRVGPLAFRASDTGPDLLPEYVHGRVELVAAASDTPAIPVSGYWHGYPITPARLTWHVESAKDGRIVLHEQTAVDMGKHLPASPSMWSTYARGTHMNMPNFGPHRYWRQPGVYLFKLTSTPFDTHRLHDGIYRLVVTASDVAGNSATGSQVFTVHNARGWLKG